MVETTEEQFRVSDGRELYMKKWLPAGDPIAKFIFVHGFSDHIHRYYELFPTLASRGILVIGYDQRGFGRTVKKTSEKGDAGPTTLILSDLVQVIQSALPSSVPVFIMGHSMGGGIILTLASTPEYADLAASIRGWILEAPLIGLYFKPNPITVLLGRLAAKIFPHRQLVQAVPPKNLSRDPEVIKSIAEDPMCDGTGSLEMFANMLDRAAHLEQGKLRLSPGIQALWLGHGTGDLTTSYVASKKWFEQQTELKDKTCVTYDGWFHQLHADTPETRAQFYKDVGNWVVSKVGEKPHAEEATTLEAREGVPVPVETSPEPVVGGTTKPVDEQAKL